MGNNYSKITDDVTTFMSTSMSAICSVEQVSNQTFDVSDSKIENCGVVDFTQDFSGQVLSCVQSMTSAEAASISQAVSASLQNSGLNFGQGNESDVSESIAANFMTSYNTSCSDLAAMTQGGVIKHSTIDCCATYAISPSGELYCENAGTFSSSQIILAPQLQCAMSAAASQTAAAASSASVSESNVGINPFDILMGFVGLIVAIVILVVVVKAMKSKGGQTLVVPQTPTAV